MANVERILIVGGRIGGLALATALHRQGFAPELVERSAAWRTAGTGIGLMANGMRVLRTLGVADAVVAGGATLRHWSYAKAQGDILCSTDLEALWGDVGPCVGIERGTLQKALLAAAAAVPSRLGVGPVGLAQDAECVTVDFSDGSRAAYDLVVGADGIHSTVRALTFGGEPARFAGQVVWRSIIPTCPYGTDEMVVIMGDGCFFGLVPMGCGHTYGFAGLDADEPFADPLPGRLGRVRRRFASLGGPVREFLSALEDDAQLRFDLIEWIEQDPWHAGSVLLIGDAAHASPPQLGQGGCMALEDAVVLSEVLRDADTVDHALATFVTRRRPRTDWVRDQSRAALNAWLLPATARDTALRERGDQIMRARYAPLLAEP